MGKSFGENLRAKRKLKGLTVQEIANMCGASRSYITLIETGKRQPGKKILPRIAVALHLKTSIVLNWYLEDIGQKIKQDLEPL